MAAGVKEVDSVEDFNKLLHDAAGNLVVVHFAAPWAPQCKQMTDVMTELSRDNQLKQVHFVQIEAEKLAEISEQNNIIAVPTFIFFKGVKPVDRLDGANAADLTKKVRGLSGGVMVASPPPPTQKQDLNTRLKQLISSAPVMLFMKGSRQEPKCGFSRQMVQILNDKNVSYSTFDILSDEEVRQGLKTYSNWPTYPQLYANGELLGGLDIVKELVETGELESQLPVKVKLEDRLSPEDSPQLSSESLTPSSSICCDDAFTQSDALKGKSNNTGNTNSLAYDGMEDLDLEGFTVTVNSSEDEEEDEDVDDGDEQEDEESLPLWFSRDSCDTPKKAPRGRGIRKKRAASRRHSQKIIQRERRALIRSDPSLLAAQREKERLRQMMIRRRDSLILSLPVDPNMSIQDANQMLMEQQREAGVPEEDITSLQIGRENFSTIGELKRKIEGKRAVDRERTRMKRAQLDEELREEMKRACRDRMREKRARLRELDPAAAAAHREREKIRKRIERRRNAMLLSIPQETIVPAIEGVEEESSPSLLPVTLAPEFSSALMVLRENLLRKRLEQKERVRQRRAELREKHPDVAAAIRERERVRKRIERRRNSLLLKLSPEALLKATQSVMSQDSNSSSDASQSLVDIGKGVASGTLLSDVQQTDKLDNCESATSKIELSSALSLNRVSASSPVDESLSQNSPVDASGIYFDGGPEWTSNIDKLKRSIQNKKDYNKERMRQKRAKLKEDPEAFEAMKERERVRKKFERLKKKGTNLIEMLNAPLTFNYDIPQSEPSSTATRSDYKGTSSEQESETVTEDSVIIKQEPVDADDLTGTTEATSSANHQLYPPQDINRMKENYTESIGEPPYGPEDTSTSKNKKLGIETNNACLPPSNQSCRDKYNASPNDVNVCRNIIKLEPDLESGGDESKEEVSVGWHIQSESSERLGTKNHWSEEWNNLPPGKNHGHLTDEKEDLENDFESSGLYRSFTSFTQPSPQKQLKKSNTPVHSTPDSIPDAGFQASGSDEESGNFTNTKDPRKITYGSSGPVNFPSFSSVEEERDWFQTQLCRIQTRVLDTASDEQTNTHEQQSETAPRGLCNTNYIPLDSPNMAAFSCYNNSVGPFSVNPFSDIAKLTSATPQNTVPTTDYLSGIAEVTLRSSLEQMTALAGPEVMQDRLRQMVESAKHAREKANEQARRRREKLRNDPAMKQKYEEIKARDMERKRQQRAKEAEIRTVFPSYNEERRIKDRERKKMNRSRCKEQSVDDDGSMIGKDPSVPTVTQMLDQGRMTPNVPSLPPPGVIIPTLGGAPNHYLTSLYAVTSQGDGGPLSQMRSPYIPQLGPQEHQSSHQADVKPHIPPNQSLAS